MHPRATELIRELRLEPHPEGGHYREVFRSDREVRPLDGRDPRAALTSIHFLLAEGQHSRWHRVRSDEAWHFREGDPLELVWVDAGGAVHSELLGGGAPGERPLCVVPAGCWQAARPTGAYALVGCTVGPGFEFDDFEMATPGSPAAEQLRAVAGLPPGLF